MLGIPSILVYFFLPKAPFIMGTFSDPNIHIRTCHTGVGGGGMGGGGRQEHSEAEWGHT